jgi:hypothetical protein
MHQFPPKLGVVFLAELGSAHGPDEMQGLIAFKHVSGINSQLFIDIYRAFLYLKCMSTHRIAEDTATVNTMVKPSHHGSMESVYFLLNVRKQHDVKKIGDDGDPEPSLSECCDQ